LFRAKTTNSALASGDYVYWQFVMTGQWDADDSVMYLLSNDGQVQGGVPQRGFGGLFSGCTSLTKAPDLPATIVGGAGYVDMFSGCTGLVLPPKLPATTLGSNAYREMFKGCTSLTTAPELPATTVPSYVYREMFYGCTSLVNVPSELPATTYSDGHNTLPYYGMFENCSSLVKAPKLRCIDYGPDMYMFYNCSSLNEVWLDWEGTFVSNQYYWASNVASSGTLHYNGPTTSHSDY